MKVGLLIALWSFYIVFIVVLLMTLDTWVTVRKERQRNLEKMRRRMKRGCGMDFHEDEEDNSEDKEI